MIGMKAKKLSTIIKRIVLAICPLLVAFALAGCSDGGVGEAEKAINDIGNVTLDSQSAIENAKEKYNALTDDGRQKVDNADVLQDAEKRFADLQYSEIKSMLEEADSLMSTYFAQHYDTNGLKAAVDVAEDAIENSQSEKYADALAELESEIAGLNSFIEKEAAESYSAANGPADTPFAIDESKLPTQWLFQPVQKQTGLNPQSVISTDDYDADPNAVIPFIQGSGRPYSYAISTVPTKMIKVQVPGGDLYDAYVNTEVNFEQLQKEPANRDKNKDLVERPGYFFMTQKGALALALQDFNGEDYYVVYGQ